MSLSVAKDKEVTVVTIKSDNKSMFPPLCQILGALCYSPVCCTVRKGLMQTNVTSALGTIQIMVGLFNIGLGPGRISTQPGDLTNLGAAYWLGAVYIISGITSLSSGRFPSVCLTGFAAFVNIAGSFFAILAVGLYAIDLGNASLDWMCNSTGSSVDDYDDNCIHVAYFAQRLLTGMDITLIVLGVLQLCVCISMAILSIKGFVRGNKEQIGGDFDIYHPMSKVMTSPGV